MSCFSICLRVETTRAQQISWESSPERRARVSQLLANRIHSQGISLTIRFPGVAGRLPGVVGRLPGDIGVVGRDPGVSGRSQWSLRPQSLWKVHSAPRTWCRTGFSGKSTP